VDDAAVPYQSVECDWAGVRPWANSSNRPLLDRKLSGVSVPVDLNEGANMYTLSNELYGLFSFVSICTALDPGRRTFQGLKRWHERGQDTSQEKRTHGVRAQERLGGLKVKTKISRR
jgi:hypothetical protein